MEVHPNRETQARLAEIAATRGSDAELLAREAIERFVEYDEWFIQEVEKGVDAADLGKLLSHEEVGSRVEKLLSGKQFRA
jgi:predicted transcriptional regulator